MVRLKAICGRNHILNNTFMTVLLDLYDPVIQRKVTTTIRTLLTLRDQ